MVRKVNRGGYSKSIKRLLSMLLAVLMVFGMFASNPVSVHADDQTCNITVQVSVDGADVADFADQLEFWVTDRGVNDWAWGTGKMDSTGKVVIPVTREIQDTWAYGMEVKQVNTGIAGMTYDTKVVEIDVHNESTGPWYTPAEITFTNKFDGTFINATKELRNGNIADYDGQFSFTLAGQGDAPMPAETTTTNNGSEVKFGPIGISEEGTYTYTITEEQGTNSDITYDTAPKTLTLTAKREKDAPKPDDNFTEKDASGAYDVSLAPPVSFNNSALAGVQLTIKNNANDEVVYANVTDGSNPVSIKLDEGTYTMSGAIDGYVVEDKTFSVDASAAKSYNNGTVKYAAQGETATYEGKRTGSLFTGFDYERKINGRIAYCVNQPFDQTSTTYAGWDTRTVWNAENDAAGATYPRRGGVFAWYGDETPNWLDAALYFNSTEWGAGRSAEGGGMGNPGDVKATSDDVPYGDDAVLKMKKVLYYGSEHNAPLDPNDESTRLNATAKETQEAVFYIAQKGRTGTVSRPSGTVGQLVDIAFSNDYSVPSDMELYVFYSGLLNNNERPQCLIGSYCPDSSAIKVNTTASENPITFEQTPVTIGNTLGEPEYGKLSISKTIAGEDADANQEFTFTVTLPEGTFNYIGSKEGTISNGGTITLKGGETVTINDIPADSEYSVSEADVPENWENTAKSGESGTIAKDATATASFTNTYTKQDDTPKTPTVATKVGVQTIKPEADQEFKDTVTLTNLTEGVEYTITGKLMDKDDKSQVTATVDPFKFTATADDAVAESVEKEMTFKVDASELAGKTLVVFETLTYTVDGEQKTVKHENYNDGDQTFTVEEKPDDTQEEPVNPDNPTVGTKVSVQTIKPEANQTFTDTITLTKLTEGVAYTITGQLMDKAQKQAVAVTTEPVTFTATAEDAAAESVTKEMTFTVDASKLAGKQLVVFETLTWTVDGDSQSVKHNNYNDAEQTFKVEPKEETPEEPSKVTVKINKTDMDGEEVDGAVIKVTDKDGNEVATWTSKKGETCNIEVVPGEYTLTEETAPSGYQKVTTAIKFTVNEDGTVTVNDTTVQPAGAVAYEGGVLVLKDAAEEPTTPGDNTDTPKPTPTIKTTAAASGDEASSQTITDTISLTNLIVGETYTITGKLMDKESNTQVTATASPATDTFTATAATMTRTMTFTLDATDYAGKDLVVFETLTWTHDKHEGTTKEVKHEDLTDTDQTVTITNTPGDEPENPDNPDNPTPENPDNPDNPNTPVNPGSTTTFVTVSKVWDDENNAEGHRPGSVTVSLLANGTATGQTVTLNSGNSWVGIFRDLPTVDASGAAIAYTVSEEQIPYYVSFVSGSAADGYTIRNYNRPWIPMMPGTPGEVGRFTVQKTVSGQAAKERAYEIQVKLTETDGTVYTSTVSLKPTDAPYAFEYLLPGTKVEVTELTTGYTTTYTVNGKSGQAFTIAAGTDAKVVVNNYSDDAYPPNTPGNGVPRTGDANNGPLWISLAVLAGMLAGMIGLRIRKTAK